VKEVLRGFWEADGKIEKSLDEFESGFDGMS
jgi:hypothetical protein